ncbi:MAG: signal recognition particle protein, partial [Bacteriovoracaceae bacterium]|nr:signal recognition particle protein [Bacteriovoracaceae bacterium]
GGLGQIMGMLPGLGGLKRQLGDLAPAEQEMRKVKVIASSMTKAERDNYHLIDASRTARIARGSGNSVQEVEAFLAKFGQMEKMMSSLLGGGMGGLGGLFGGGGMPGMPGKKKNKPKQTPWGKSYF